MSGQHASASSFAIEPHGRTFFGVGTLNRLPELVLALGGCSAFIVTDRGVAAAGGAARLETLLREAGIAAETFDRIQPNPSVEHLEAGAEVIRLCASARESVSDLVVVALGGGAVLDVAKGLALMAVNTGSAGDFEYHREPQRPGLPVIALPTTAGTGSETNPWGVIDDPAAGRKFYVGHASVQPRFVILDPELTLSLPRFQTAAAGVDALAHALESLSSARRNPYADALNREVVGMIWRSLPLASSDGRDVAARGDLLLAAHMAGLAFATTGLGVAHALAHGLSARIGAPHGVALAILLPSVLAFNMPARRHVYACLAERLGLAGDGQDETSCAEALVDGIRQLTALADMPTALHQLGLRPEQIPLIVEDALEDEVMANTPRYPSAYELTDLLRRAM